MSFLQQLLNDPCVYCYGVATTEDHILPKSQGGPDWWMNIAPSCFTCNVKKGSRTIIEALMGWDWKYEQLQRLPPTSRAMTARSRRDRLMLRGQEDRVRLNSMQRVVQVEGLLGPFPIRKGALDARSNRQHNGAEDTMKYRWTTISGGQRRRDIVEIQLTPIQDPNDNRILSEVELVFSSVAELAEFTNTLLGALHAHNQQLKRPYAEAKVSTVTRHRRAKRT